MEQPSLSSTVPWIDVINDLSVVVAADHGATLLGIRSALDGHGFEIIGEPVTASETVTAARTLEPHIVLLDSDLSGDVLGAVSAIADGLECTSVVLLASSASGADLIAAIRAGARGYLMKTMDPERLACALRSAVLDEAAVPRSLVRHLVQEVRNGTNGASHPSLVRRGVRLTAREAEVLELLGRDLSTRDIADTLGISAVTVRRHASQVVHKLDAGDRSDAVGILRRARFEDA
jgi:two-component system, NarL family, nitrate/nitrite response regulator NarL